MSTPQADAAAPVIEALRDADPRRAQSCLDATAGALPDTRRAVLQARIHLAAGETESAAAILESLPRRPASVTALLARAYLNSGDPARALEVSETQGREATAAGEALKLAKLRLKAAATLGDGARAVAVVEPIVADHGDDPEIQRLGLRALLVSDAVEAAARLIDRFDPGAAPSDATLADFIARGLRGGQGALLAASLPAIERLARAPLDRLLARAWKGVDAAADPSAALASLNELVLSSGSAMLSLKASWLLRRDGRTDAAIDLVRRFRARRVSDETAAPLRIDRAGGEALVREVPNSELLMDWLGIPAGEREPWLLAVRQGVSERRHMQARWIGEPGAWEDFASAVTPPEAPELKALSAAGKPAILATTHAGELLGTLVCFRKWGVPVQIIGGHPVHREVLDGGEMLNPIPQDASGARIARDVIRFLREGRIVGLSGDGRHGNSFVPVEHRGARFDMPDSIPQIAYRMKVPIYWTATYWRDGGIECDARPGPGPRPQESYEAFRARWFDFVLDASHAICRADPANALPIAARIRPAG